MRSKMRFGGGLLACAIVCAFGAVTRASAQDRPLETATVDVLPPGTMRGQLGFDFLQGIEYPLSGLGGDLTSVGDMDLRLGLGGVAEVELTGAVQQFLDVKSQGMSFVPLQLTGPNSTHDTGDYSMIAKFKVFGESGRRPAVSVRFGFILPNTNQTRGIGNNATDVFAEFVVGRHFGNWDVFGNLGLEIMTSPNALYSQNDEFLYGLAFSYPLKPRIHLVGEVAGRQDTRRFNAGLLGTESRGEGRLGLQISAGGFRWDVAGIAGVYANDPRTGFTFGVSKDIQLFHPAQTSKP
jgi:hypothetical protein